MRAYLIFAVLLLAPRRADACKCPDPRPTALEALATADAVFEGTVVSRSPFLQRFGSELVVLERRDFVLHEAWRGPHQPRITIIGGYAPFSCDPRFDVGSRYLVFAYSSHESPVGLQTSICVPTRLYTRSSQALRDLGPGYSVTPPTTAGLERPVRRRLRILHSALLFGIASSVDLFATSGHFATKFSPRYLLAPLVLLAALCASVRLAFRRRFRLLAWLSPVFSLAVAIAVALQGLLFIRSDPLLAHWILATFVGA